MALSKITNLSITDDTILNADVNSSAAIALSKLATDPSNATNLASGTVPTARLGSGTASSSTVLYGDQTYKAEPGGGKLLSTAIRSTAVSTTFSSTSYTASDIYATITPTAASSTILVIMNYRIQAYQASGTNLGGVVRLYSDIDSAGFNAIYPTAGSTIGALSYGDAGDTAEREMSVFQTFTF